MKQYPRPHTKTKLILAYKLSHPHYSTRKIATVLQMPYTTVYGCLHTYDALGKLETLSHLPNLIGQMKDLVVPTKEAPPELPTPIEPASRGQEVLREILLEDSDEPDEESAEDELKMQVLELEIIVDALTERNKRLVGVIEYLEGKLGIDEIDARLEATKD
jgi:hypothetical protein